jgi:hypothetical protein
MAIFSSFASLYLSLALFCMPHVLASPIFHRQADLPALTPSQISAFRPFTFYASAAYCRPAQLSSWTCGSESLPPQLCLIRVFELLNLTIAENCKANPTFQPVAAGGDGNDVQFWYVGIDPTLKVHRPTPPGAGTLVSTTLPTSLLTWCIRLSS